MPSATHTTLPADSNQALGIANYAIDFMATAQPDAAVLQRTNLFHTDACLCGTSAIALGTNAPTVLREEAAQYAAVGSGVPWAKGAVRAGVPVYGSTQDVAVEKAIVANCAAVREWDSNGTNFGFNPQLGHTAGEFGHNDFYPVAVAAAQLAGKDGAFALRGMVLIDEIRGRLAEVFSLKTYKIDHVVHGAIGSVAAFGAMMGATPAQIESAIGMVVAHYIPFRAIRAGKQLSDSKGSSAAITTEAAILAMKRSMAGFMGPQDIIRNREAIFCFFKPETPKGKSPFDLVLATSGSDFAVMGMHFKLGLYEHQSAGALQGLIDLLRANRQLIENGGEKIAKMLVRAYQPAFGIIGDPAKRDPKTRQSADHSMLYLVCTMLRKAIELKGAGLKEGNDAAWKALMLMPEDFTQAAINHPLTRKLMEKMTFEHGGPEYDKAYPDGIPTSIVITDSNGKVADSGRIMYPSGHARNTTASLSDILNHKFELMGRLTSSDAKPIVARLSNLESKTAKDIASLYDFAIVRRGSFD